jgi:hypothetical protein
MVARVAKPNKIKVKAAGSIQEQREKGRDGLYILAKTFWERNLIRVATQYKLFGSSPAK